MNVILIVSDSLRADHVRVYQELWGERNQNGGPPVAPYFRMHTPHLDRLAAEGVLFERAHAGSYATVPNRYELLTGRFVCTYTRGWEPLPAHEIVLAQVLGDAGYTSMLILDTPNLLRDGYHFDRGYTAWHWIRGQEGDRYRTAPVHVELPCAPEKLRTNPRYPDGSVVGQYLRNVADRRSEEDYFAPQTFGAAIRWLEENAGRDRFFLHVDTFDPHEPWDPPARYVDLYDPGYTGEAVIYPRYGSTDVLSDAELHHCRALYAAEVTMVDRWVGKLLQAVDDLGLRENTAIFFLADHGFVLGEHGWIGKGTFPLYEVLNHVPLLMRIPGIPEGQVVPAYAQAADLMPTILDLCGVDAPGARHGRSLVPVLHGDAAHVREVCISTTSLTTPTGPGNAQGGLRTMIQRPGWAMLYGPGAAPRLFDTTNDPCQEHNVYDSDPEVARELHAAFVAFLHEVQAPETIIEPIASDERFRS